MKSLGSKVKQIGAMADTKDLNSRENGFVKDMVRITNDGRDTTMLTPKQVEWIDQLYDRHFADG
jgi:hypothetical protein